VAPSSVKETRYFLPARYGLPLEPLSVYERYWVHAGDEPIRLEASPMYFYGGDAVVAEIRQALDDPKVIVVLREPVSRFESFFNYQKARLRIPERMTVSEYLAIADALTDDDFRSPENEKFFGYRGGVYADHLPAWLERFGEHLQLLFFDDLVAHTAVVLDRVATFLGIDPSAYPSTELGSENRTAGFRNRAFQRAALAFNTRFEPFLRRHHGVKRAIRSAYFRINARPMREPITDEDVALLTERYREPNARLVEQLEAAGIADGLPAWLASRLGEAAPS
jgi:hypothetical protein